MSLDGDTALLGALFGTNTEQGSADVFVRTGGNWTFQQQLTASDGAFADWFGFSVSLDGDTALVGAPLDDIGANENQGSAHVFTRTGTSWNSQQKLTGSGGSAHDQFGATLSLHGDTALVGAPFNNVGANENQGSASLLARTGTTWNLERQLTASNGAPEDVFGLSVSLDGDTTLVGAPYDDVAANFDQGSAYFFRAIPAPYGIFLPRVVNAGP